MNKKNKILFIFSIILLIILFLNNWFSNELFSRLWVLSFGITIFIMILWLICLIFSIINYKHNEYFTPVLILILAFIISFVPLTNIKVSIELKLYEKQRNEIIENVKNNKYSYYYEGNIKLPKYKYVSSDGEIYVYQNDKNGIVIGFWIFRGALTGSDILMYSSKGKELIKANETGHPIISIEKLKNHWYYVTTDY